MKTPQVALLLCMVCGGAIAQTVGFDGALPPQTERSSLLDSAPADSPAENRRKVLRDALRAQRMGLKKSDGIQLPTKRLTPDELAALRGELRRQRAAGKIIVLP